MLPFFVFFFLKEIKNTQGQFFFYDPLLISSASKVSLLCLRDKVFLSEGNTTTNDSHIFNDVLKVNSLTITSINSENFHMHFFFTQSFLSGFVF